LPARDTTLAVLNETAAEDSQLLLMFLSDGAPSDHNELECRKHGVCVWQVDEEALELRNGKQRLRDCATAAPCRTEIRQYVREECCKKIVNLGDMFGRDRMCVNTVAFGPPGEDYLVLEEMAKQLPRSSFQKLGLSAVSLRSAMTSLSSSLTTLRTSGGTLNGMTMRSNLKLQENIGLALKSYTAGANEVILAEDGWDIYGKQKIVSKITYSRRKSAFVKLDLLHGATGVAMRGSSFARGVERAAFMCSEICDVRNVIGNGPRGGAGTPAATKCGEMLVAKETLYSEQLRDNTFHTDMCKVQAEAQQLAELFNARLGERRLPGELRRLLHLRGAGPLLRIRKGVDPRRA
jgi:hypothetical protein